MKHYFEEGRGPQITWSELSGKSTKDNSFSIPIRETDLFSQKQKLIGELNQEILQMQINV